jgi:hypothetical protein
MASVTREELTEAWSGIRSTDIRPDPSEDLDERERAVVREILLAQMKAFESPSQTSSERYIQ